MMYDELHKPTERIILQEEQPTLSGEPTAHEVVLALAQAIKKNKDAVEVITIRRATRGQYMVRIYAGLGDDYVSLDLRVGDEASF